VKLGNNLHNLYRFYAMQMNPCYYGNDTDYMMSLAMSWLWQSLASRHEGPGSHLGRSMWDV
jgi:hypothetical protein